MTALRGFFGKIPSHGDFIDRGLAAGFKDKLDEWLQQGLASSKAVIGDDWLLTPRFDVVYNDKTFFDANNTVEISQQGSVTTLNLSMGVGPEHEKWQIMLSVFNATDELYATGGNSSLTTGSGYAEIAYARPRQYFAYLNFNF